VQQNSVEALMQQDGNHLKPKHAVSLPLFSPALRTRTVILPITSEINWGRVTNWNHPKTQSPIAADSAAPLDLCDISSRGRWRLTLPQSQPHWHKRRPGDRRRWLIRNSQSKHLSPRHGTNVNPGKMHSNTLYQLNKLLVLIKIMKVIEKIGCIRVFWAVRTADLKK